MRSIRRQYAINQLINYYYYTVQPNASNGGADVRHARQILLLAKQTFSFSSFDSKCLLIIIILLLMHSCKFYHFVVRVTDIFGHQKKMTTPLPE